jgi:hypothetical protein
MLLCEPAWWHWAKVQPQITNICQLYHSKLPIYLLVFIFILS